MYEELKDRLRNYKKILAKKNELEYKIEELEQNLGLKEILQGDPISKTYKISSATENDAIDLVENKEKLKLLINTYRIEISRIENALNGIHHLQKQAIELKYIEKRNIESICYIMNRTNPSIVRYLNDGLKEINDILTDDFV